MPQGVFVVNTIRRLLKSQGQVYEFTRQGKNDYGEPSGEPQTVAKITGLYHETFVSPVLTTQEASQTRKLQTPSILCLWSDFEKEDIQVGDELSIGRNKYVVQSAVDIQKMNVAVDIVLALVEDDGLQF